MDNTKAYLKLGQVNEQHIRGVFKNTQTKILTEKFLSLFVILFYQNKLEIIYNNLIYNQSRYLKPIINSAHSNLDVFHKLAISIFFNIFLDKVNFRTFIELVLGTYPNSLILLSVIIYFINCRLLEMRFFSSKLTVM